MVDFIVLFAYTLKYQNYTMLVSLLKVKVLYLQRCVHISNNTSHLIVVLSGLKWVPLKLDTNSVTI